MIKFPFGEHKGERLEDIDEEYLLWAVDLPDLRPTLREAIRKQLSLDNDRLTDTDVLPRVIFSWWQEMKERFPADHDRFVIAAGLETFKALCSEATGRPWPPEEKPVAVFENDLDPFAAA
jgi:hypothetical protein